MMISRKTALATAFSLVALTGLGTAAIAQDAPSLADLGSDSALAAAFKKMSGSVKMPEWISTGIVTTPSQKVSFDGKEWIAMSGCKPHDCAAEQIAVIYSPASGEMFGVLSQMPDENQPQTLRWLNMQGGAETIDGRTILFAALTGSLANHPEAFNYAKE